MNPVIYWFRRDLRLNDNLGLHEAINSASPVIPLFIIDPILINSQYVGAARLRFLLDALQSLDESLRKYGSQLIIRRGKPVRILREIIAEANAQALYFNRDYSPYARKRDSEIEQTLSIPIHSFDDAILLPPNTILKNDGKPYVVYTPFWKKWKEEAKPAISKLTIRSKNFYDTDHLTNDGIPEICDLGHENISSLAIASADKALSLLEQFKKHDLYHYAEKRNFLAIHPYNEKHPEGTSFLSPYLRLGLLSPRQAYWAAREAYQKAKDENQQKSVETWVSELAWREFYMHILYFFPHVLERDFVDTYQSLEWRDAPDELQAWKDGMTGYPIVDAAMRQLNSLGWMPNRARMIVASFLTKDLLIHWKHGEHYFMQHLIDGDPAANNGGWQWAAGTGTDAQPYFRIFNPVSQSKKFATPRYLKYWLVELRDVPDKYIHEPWTMPNPPKAYPEPIVEHTFARERTLVAFKTARGD